VIIQFKRRAEERRREEEKRREHWGEGETIVRCDGHIDFY
jgi:hypothetical protein